MAGSIGEATALHVADIDLGQRTARISDAWKYTGDGSDRLGATKTRRSVRTINIPERVFDELDLDRPGDALLFATVR